MNTTKKIPQDASLCMRLLDQQHKFPICVIKRRYPKTKNCPNRNFPNNICDWNPINQETFLFSF